MSNETFTQLPTVGNAALSDIICAVQGYISPASPGLSVQETFQQIYNLFQSNIILFNAGDPNGLVAGSTYTFLWDTVNNLLWVCTTTGSSSTAVWQTFQGSPTNGQILIGNTGNAPSLTTITAGTNISVTNAAGSITIAGSGAAGFSWNSVTGTSQAMTASNGYVANNASLVTLTLPLTAAFGTEIVIVGKGTGGWLVAQNASQSIVLSSSTSTAGVGGSLASTQAKDCIVMTCTVADLEWTVISSMGNITVV